MMVAEVLRDAVRAILLRPPNHPSRHRTNLSRKAHASNSSSPGIVHGQLPDVEL